MKILGLDVGQRRVGVAFGFGSVASPFKILTGRNQEMLEEIAKICEEEDH